MDKKVKRVIMAFIGVFLTGMSIAIFKTADLGTDPFTSFNLGLSNVSGVSYGIVFTVMTGLLLVGVFVIKRHYIGIATVLNLLLTGVIAEKFMGMFGKIFPEPQMFGRVLLLVAALILMCFATSLYFTADLGVSAYDAWALILAERKVAPFRACRIGTDVICVLAGAVMGIFPGIGTLVTAFGMGPLIEFFNKRFSVPLLDGTLLMKRNEREMDKKS